MSRVYRLEKEWGGHAHTVGPMGDLGMILAVIAADNRFSIDDIQYSDETKSYTPWTKIEFKGVPATGGKS